MSPYQKLFFYPQNGGGGGSEVLISNANQFFFRRGGRVEGGRAPAVASMRAAGWLTGFLPSPLLLSLGDAPPPLRLTRIMFHVHDARTRYWIFDGFKKLKKSRRRRRAGALYSPLKASLCVSRSQAASTFSITKGGGEERGEERRIK